MPAPTNTAAQRAAYEAVMRDLLHRAATRLAREQGRRDAADERVEETNEQEPAAPDQARTPGFPAVASRRTHAEDGGAS
jgi:hypothetical protein